MTAKKKPITDPNLASWEALNAAIMQMDEQQARALLKKELNGRRRSQFLKRIHSRINKVRADRERAELEEKLQ